MDEVQLVDQLREGLMVTLARAFDGISGESGVAEVSVSQRLLGLEPSKGHAGKYVAYVASDGLSLQSKIVVEKQLQAFVSSQFPDLRGFLTYFRRLNPAPRTSTSTESQQNTPQGAATISQSPRQVSAPLPFGVKKLPRPVPGVKNVIVVASGKGGVGKSTVSVNLAIALQRQGLRVGLLDADIYGPSVPMMLGIQGPLQVNSSNQLIPVIGHGIKAVSLGLISDLRTPAIWRGPMVAKALEQLVYDVDWSPLDYLVIDLPPGTGDVQLTLIENVTLAGAVIVSTPQDVALIDAHKAVSMFYKLSIPILGLVENMSFHTCSKCGHEDPVFGTDGTDHFATERDIPILARLPIDREVRIGGDTGKPVAAQIGSEIAPLFDGLARQVFAATVTVRDSLTH